MKIAFIVQRYGAEILGGSEYHCRLIAERLAQKHDVEVLTTCARDYITWDNEYPEGNDRIRGVTVRRFKNARTRDITSFNQYSDWIFNHPHTREDELSWLEQQGPWCPPLLEYLNRNHRQYNALIFFTYLYAPTVLGLDVDPARSILVPTAHNEPAIRLSIYKEMFAKPAAVAYNTEVEKNFLKTTFEFRSVAEETVGCGVDLMQEQQQPDDPEPEDDEELHKRLAPHLRARGAQFRRRHRLQGQFLLYGGRIDAGKGCEELIEYFTSYKEQGGEAQLTLMGVKLMQLPEVPWVRFAGLLSERERLQALEAAAIVVVPSPYESLSLLALEAMAVGTPVLCNARAEVLVDHCLKSNAGLFYSDRDEFVECTKLLLADDRMRDRMGRNGKEYVKRNYRWDVILSKYRPLDRRPEAMKLILAALLFLQPGPRPALTPAETLLEPVILRAINEQPSGGMPASLIEGSDKSAGEILITCRECDVATHAMQKLHQLITEKGMTPPARSIRRVTGSDSDAIRGAKAAIFVAQTEARPLQVVRGLWSTASLADEVVEIFARHGSYLVDVRAFENVGQLQLDHLGVPTTTIVTSAAVSNQHAAFVAAASAYFLATLPNAGAEALLAHLTVGAHGRLAEDGRRAVAQMGSQQRASADVLVMLGQAIEREQRRMRSFERFMAEPVDAMLRSRIADMEKGITSVWTSIGITSSPFVPAAERLRGRAGEDRRVPVRTSAPVAPLEPPAALEKLSNVRDVVYELTNFIDGRRSISDIRDAVAAEFGTLPLPAAVEYFERLTKAGVITLR